MLLASLGLMLYFLLYYFLLDLVAPVSTVGLDRRLRPAVMGLDRSSFELDPFGWPIAWHRG